ncbi:MAG: hypothetical protein J0H14_14320 [Alphaproteobacteria bacterium]|nr:hypothetical protein [Alphaproteobacteria bacterium]
MHSPVFPDGADPTGAVRTLSGEALLATWERCSAGTPSSRALAMLCAGRPTLAHADAAALSLATRDAALLELHASKFGPDLSAFVACDACGERLEFELRTADIAATLQAADVSDTMMLDGVMLRLRMANTIDIAEAAAASDLEAAHDVLLARCTEGVNPAELPDALRDAVLARLEAMHEAAEISFSLGCPACAARQAIQFDIASFLWAEIRHAARNLLDDVHELAWAYGWAESAILAMSPQRRAAYLERVRG